MGCYGSRYLAGLVGPVRGAAPLEPRVIGIDQEGVVPSAESLPAGDNAQFLILFDQSAYVADISEFSTDQFGDVMLSLVPGTDNLLQIGISSALPAGAEFSVFWRDQPIINVTIADVLRILSVNGSTHFPLEIYAGAGDAVKFDIEFSHEYDPTIDDFVVEPASAGTMAKGSDGLWAFTPNDSAVGSSVNIFCIEQWISKVDVVADVVMNPNISSINADVPFTHNLSSLLGQSIADWKLDSVDMFGGSTFASRGTCGLHYNSDLMKWMGSSGSSWGSYGIEISLLNGKIIGGPSVYKVGKITINGVVHNIDEFN